MITASSGNCKSATPTEQLNIKRKAVALPASFQQQKLTRLAVYLRENVLHGLVIVLVLGLGVGWRVAPLPAPLHHLSGLWGCEGLQAR